MRIPDRVRDIELPQFDLLNDVAASWRARGADVINLGQALPGFAPPQLAIETLRNSLSDSASHIYSSDAGIPELRTALAELLGELGARIDPEREIIITAGGNQAFQLALTTLVDFGDEVILASPYFLNHEMAVRSVGAVPIEAPVSAERRFVATWADLAPCLTPRTRAVVLVTPSNPTGAVISLPGLQEIVSECAQRDLTVIVDETYLQFVYDSPPSTAVALPHWRETLIVVGSFSKAYAITGWRCGYLVANRDVISEAMKIQDCMVICAPVPVQRAMAAVLEREPDYPRRWLPELNERRDFLVTALRNIPGLDPVPPAGGFFVMVRVADRLRQGFGESAVALAKAGCTDSRALAMQLIEEQQIVTIPGRYFGESGEGYLRLSYGAAPLDRLRAACDRLARFIKR